MTSILQVVMLGVLTTQHGKRSEPTDFATLQGDGLRCGRLVVGGIRICCRTASRSFIIVSGMCIYTIVAAKRSVHGEPQHEKRQLIISVHT
jgi:hypothetical protein